MDRAIKSLMNELQIQKNGNSSNTTKHFSNIKNIPRDDMQER